MTATNGEDVPATERAPLLCRLLGHRVRGALTDDFWRAVQMRCTRCGWTTPNTQTAPERKRLDLG